MKNQSDVWFRSQVSFNDSVNSTAGCSNTLSKHEIFALHNVNLMSIDLQFVCIYDE